MSDRRAQWESMVADVQDGATRTSAAKKHGIPKDFVTEQVTRQTKAGRALLEAEGIAQVKAEQALMKAAAEPDRNGRRDSKAALQWLTNRDHENWRERREETVNVNHRLQEEIAERRKQIPPGMRDRLKQIGSEMILGVELPKPPTADETVH